MAGLDMWQKLQAKWAELWSFLDKVPPVIAWKTAVGLWLLFGVIAGTIVAVEPDRRSATIEYRLASEKWWQSESGVYRQKNGYLYLPQFAIIYSPFERLPTRVGEPLWRLVILGLLAAALYQACRRWCPQNPAMAFLIATLLVVPSALSNARNGQTNMPLGALYLLTAIALSHRRWNLSALLLVLSLALKPISVVPILLVGTLYPRTILPLIAGLAILFGAAFLHPHPSYVWGQYQEFWETLLRAGRPQSHTWCDFAGMFRSFGLPLPDAVSLAIRALFAAVTLGFAWQTVRRLDPGRAAFVVLLFAAIYLMLFNPRTETNSYVILGAFVGLLGAHAGIIEKNLRAAAWFLLLALLLGTENYANPIYPWTNLWQKALTTFVLAGWIVWQLQKTPPAPNILPGNSTV
jgi:alpha-1,2-mannosyltransferase